VWGVLGTSGLVALSARGATVGRSAVAPQELPVGAELTSRFRTAGRATLVVVAHPACPCTRATFRALERLRGTIPFGRQSADGLDVVVLFAGSRAGASALADRVAGELRAQARDIPGVRIIDDPGGVAASRLGARTSGTVLFYDRSGSLRFNGGITPGRGHEGDSHGADALRALLQGETAAGAAGATSTTHAAPVFGCELADRDKQ